MIDDSMAGVPRGSAYVQVTDAVVARHNVTVRVWQTRRHGLRTTFRRRLHRGTAPGSRVQRRSNLPLTTGRNQIRDHLYGDAVNGLTHYAVGTGSSAVEQSDPGLGNEVFRDAITKLTKDTGKLTIQYYLASGSANGNTICEAGPVNAAAAGSFYARVVHDSIEKTSNVEITYTHELTWTAST